MALKLVQINVVEIIYSMVGGYGYGLDEWLWLGWPAADHIYGSIDENIISSTLFGFFFLSCLWLWREFSQAKWIIEARDSHLDLYTKWHQADSANIFKGAIFACIGTLEILECKMLEYLIELYSLYHIISGFEIYPYHQE